MNNQNNLQFNILEASLAFSMILFCALVLMNSADPLVELWNDIIGIAEQEIRQLTTNPY